MTRPDNDAATVPDAAGIGPWPPEIQALVDAVPGASKQRGSAGRVLRSNGPDMWRSGAARVQRFDGPDGRPRTTELLQRLSARSFPTTGVLGGADRWLVTAALPGEPADKPDLHPDPDDLVVAVGQALRALHDLPVSLVTDVGSATAAGGWEAIAQRCRQAVEAGLIDSARLPYPYDQYQPADLLSMFIDGRPQRRPEDEESVCCHGAPVMQRFMVDRGTFRGFDRIETMVAADRHLDLAVIHRSVQDLMAPEAVFRLYDAYGAEPDLVRLDHYILASHLTPGLLGESDVDPSAAIGHGADPADENQAAT